MWRVVCPATGTIPKLLRFFSLVENPTGIPIIIVHVLSTERPIGKREKPGAFPVIARILSMEQHSCSETELLSCVDTPGCSCRQGQEARRLFLLARKRSSLTGLSAVSTASFARSRVHANHSQPPCHTWLRRCLFQCDRQDHSAHGYDGCKENVYNSCMTPRGKE